MPSAEDQLRFVTRIQALILGSDHAATYKLPFLLSMGDLCMESPVEPDEDHDLDWDSLALSFAEYYWPIAERYIVNGESHWLRQGTSSRNAVTDKLREYRIGDVASKRFADARKDERFRREFLPKIKTTLRSQPATYLQPKGEHFL